MSPPEPGPSIPIATFLKAIDWPVMPEVGQALIRTLGDEDADTFAVCRIIGKDPALTAALLRMANSALFGLSGSVATLERALRVVGVARVRSRALSVCMARVASLPLGLDRIAFWRYCMLCAGYAQWLAELCDVDDQQAWLGGMMLRLGEINLGQAHASALPQLAAQPDLPGERWLRQRLLTGFDEGQLTAELAQHWDYPHALVSGLRNAAQPLAAPEFSRLAGVLHLAARLADSGPITAQTINALPSLLLRMLPLDPHSLSLDPPDAYELTDISMFQR